MTRSTATKTFGLDVARPHDTVPGGIREPDAYVGLLGLRGHTTLSLLEQLRRGLPYRAFERFRRHAGIPTHELAELIQIPVRTLSRRKEQGRLQPGESDRLVRVARVFAGALALFEGEPNAARRWLATPQRALGGHAPLEFAKTELGAREVENLIGQMEHGIPS